MPEEPINSGDLDREKTELLRKLGRWMELASTTGPLRVFVDGLGRAWDKPYDEIIMIGLRWGWAVDADPETGEVLFINMFAPVITSFSDKEGKFQSGYQDRWGVRYPYQSLKAGLIPNTIDVNKILTKSDLEILKLKGSYMDCERTVKYLTKVLNGL